MILLNYLVLCFRKLSHYITSISPTAHLHEHIWRAAWIYPADVKWAPTKAFDCVDHNKLWKILQEMGIPDHLICLLRNLYVGQEATVRTGHETTDWFQIGKGVRQAVYCRPVYLTSMQSTSWETLSWKKHKLESRLPGEISITSYADDSTLMAKVKKN